MIARKNRSFLGRFIAWLQPDFCISVQLDLDDRRQAPETIPYREAMVALDFFTVPTVTFQLLCCFFVIEHAHRNLRVPKS
jgi:hypothetical protein